MQLTPSRSDWSSLQEAAGRKLVCGPYNWIPAAWLFDRRADVSLPSTMVDLNALHEAVLIRTAKAFPPLAKRASTLRSAMSGDNEPLLHPWATWRLLPMVQILAEFQRRRNLGVPPQGTSIQTFYYRSVLASQQIASDSQTWERRLERWRHLQRNAPFPRLLRLRANKYYIYIEKKTI